MINREMDRTIAITEAIKAAGPNEDVVVLAAKGLMNTKDCGVDTPYETLALHNVLLTNWKPSF